MITLILGGVRSGKSTRAVELARRSRGRVWFIATARRRDREMCRRIAAHRRQRPAAWRTIEESRRVPEKLAALPRGATAVLDCVTLWIGGLAATASPERISGRVAALLAAVRRRRLRLVAVSNEVGSGVIPPTRLGRKFEDALGAANTAIAAKAQRVELMIAGIPIALKPAKR